MSSTAPQPKVDVLEPSLARISATAIAYKFRHISVCSVCLFVCVMDMTVRCAKTAEPIVMQCEISTRVDPLNRVLDGIHRSAIWRILLNDPC